MALAQDLIDQVSDEAIFDATDAQVLVWLNRRYATMITRAKYLRKTIALGDTVADQAFYELDTSIVELISLTLAGAEYKKGRRSDVYASSQNAIAFTGPGGVIIEDADAEGVRGITLVPTPSSGGDALEAFAACRPAPLVPSDAVDVPEEYLDALVEGCMATGLSRDTEQLGAADRMEGRFDSKCEELRLHVQRKFRIQPSQIRMLGINA